MTRVLTDLSFLICEPDAAYREQAKSRLTSHELAEFRRDPYLYHKKKLGLVTDEDRPAYLVGRAAHVLILEGQERFQEEYAVGGPVNSRTGEPFGRYTKTFEEWAAAQGKPVLTHDDVALIQKLSESVRSHALAKELLASGAAESVVRTEYCGIPSQARLDWVNPDRGLVDLKTCDHVNWFEGEARGFGYLHQLAFYRALLFQAAGVIAPVFLIAVEKREPFRTGVFVIAPDVLAAAQKENEQAIERLIRCRAADHWPTGYEALRTIDYL
ncbi:MAG: PD-(D/E)XK nuclease-like domain-containing protein [Phycisphaeraceae bacterium]|nr:PD-(D/E)XK nuclease-like domain-containing protein [Phycisphaeraceae bacterium]